MDHHVSATPDQRLAALAATNLGLFTLAQAVACGLPARTVQRRAAAGRYLRRWPGVYALAGAPDGRDHRWLAAQFAVGGDAVLARATAADLHGLEHRLPLDRIHLAVRNRSFHGAATVDPEVVVVHRASRLDEDQIARVGALPVTSVGRTLCDLAPIVPVERLRALVAAAVRRGLIDADGLRRLATDLGRFRGKRRLLPLLDDLSPLEPQARSALESRFLAVTTRAGVPPTAMNYPTVDGAGRTRWLDAVYLPENVPVELDSRAFHGTLLDWHDDLRRESWLKLAGWRDPLRFSAADLRDHPAEVVDVIRRTLEVARREMAMISN